MVCLADKYLYALLASHTSSNTTMYLCCLRSTDEFDWLAISKYFSEPQSLHDSCAPALGHGKEWRTAQVGSIQQMHLPGRRGMRMGAR